MPSPQLGNHDSQNGFANICICLSFKRILEAFENKYKERNCFGGHEQFLTKCRSGIVEARKGKNVIVKISWI